MFRNLFGKSEGGEGGEIAKAVLEAIEQRVDTALITLQQEPGAREGDAEDRILRKLDHLNAVLAVATGDPLADREAVSGPVPTVRVPERPAWMMDVESLIRQENKIMAIKIYREHTRVGLKEAKDAVDAMEVRMRLR
jgi:hypothetical protein